MLAAPTGATIMIPLNPFRLVRRMVAPVAEPPEEVTERVQLLEEPDENATGPGEVNPA
jgi:hypothetical protein